MFNYVAGVDEAGRGPLAGPVYAACVILGQAVIPGIDDSKKLTARKRETLAIQIQTQAVAWAIAYATVEEIDRLNIFQATLLAMQRAVEGLTATPSEVLIDGTHCPKIAFPSRAIVQGDRLIPEISAASILAKTARDAEILRLHEIYPCYNFARHKGYPTAEHRALLQQHGACPIHRQSFAPVKAALIYAANLFNT